MKVSELKIGDNKVDIKLTVKEIIETKDVMTKFGTNVRLTNVLVGDTTGDIKLVLWGEKSNGIEPGKRLEIKNAFVNDFRGELQLNLGRYGDVKVV